MNKQKCRVDYYCTNQCYKCIYANCNYWDCDECDNNIEENSYGYFCACLHDKKNKEEKTCPFFKVVEK